MPGTGSKGKHGGGHKDRQRAGDASTRKQAEREKQARIARARGQRDTSGKKGKPSGKEGGSDLGGWYDV